MDTPPASNGPTRYARLLSSGPGMLIVSIAFLWYVIAIGVYAIPGESRWPLAMWLRGHVYPVVAPSVLISSQWQQWNLFSPNPLRRVSEYKLEAFAGGNWQPLITLQPGVFPWWRNANHFKLLINIMEGSNPQIAERYVQSFCIPFHLPAGTEVKVTYLISVIPYLETPETAAWWRSWNMEFAPEGGFSTFCPETPVSPMYL